MDKVVSELASVVKDFPDFPKKGILFKDIMPIFRKPQLVADLCNVIAEHCRTIDPPIQVVTALEARGFLFAPQVAINLGVPFVPIRKSGKLPGELISASYLKEYGEDVVQIQKDAIPKKANVFILDDLLATGGTLKAAIEVVQKAGGNVVHCLCVIELMDLKGTDKLGGVSFKSLMKV